MPVATSDKLIRGERLPDIRDWVLSKIPQEYIKSASVAGNTLTLTMKDGSTITFNPSSVNVINNLTSDSTTDALSAAQGKALKALIDALTARVVTLEGKSVPDGTFLAY